LWDVASGLQIGPALGRLVLWRPGVESPRGRFALNRDSSAEDRQSGRFELMPSGTAVVASQGGRYVTILAVPPTATGDLASLRLRFRVTTGQDVDESGRLTWLDPSVWREERQSAVPTTRSLRASRR